MVDRDEVADMPAGDGADALVRPAGDAAEVAAGPAGDGAAGSAGPSAFQRIQGLTLALAEATSVDGVLDTIVGSSLAATGAGAGTVLLYSPDGSRFEVVRQRGYGDEIPASFPADHPELPGSTALERDEVVVLDARHDTEPFERARSLARQHGYATIVVVPITTPRASIGSIALAFEQAFAPTVEERELFHAVGRHCGVAIERARLIARERQAVMELEDAREQAEVARDRLAFLVRVGREVLGTLDQTQVLERVLELAVPRIADGGLAVLPTPEGLRRVAVAHGNPDIAAIGRERLVGTLIPYDAAIPAAACYRSGEVVLDREAGPEAVGDLPPRARSGLANVSLRAWLCVPIRTGSHVLGVLGLAWSDPRLLDDPEHLAITVELASRAAAGLVNAQLYENQRDAARALKGSVLPAVLPHVPGIDLAARYRPSGSDVGGDWYDALVLPDGRVAVTVGDVSGHGLPAGATMGQLRNAVRAYALDGHSPGGTLSRLGRLLAATSSEHVASVVHAVLDPGTGQLEWSSAGHLPVLVTGDDGTQVVSPPGGTLLGAEAGPSFADGRFVLEPGQALVLYTDGLVERRDEGIDDSIARLAAQVGAVGAASAEELADRALGVTSGRELDDDVCVLVVRRT